jgi:2-polyprenyl-6-methoxyphenol hydroxylase-like FAD-dependent oxidoreductase
VRVLVIGGSAAGSFAALLLARAGHDVLVVEKDQLDVAPDVESAATSAYRATAPHIVQPHIIMARCRQLLVEHLPDVYGDLLDAGVVEAPLATQMPSSLADTTPRAGDEQLSMLMTRRSTFDWVLRRALAAQPRVALRCGVMVTELLADPGQPPHVTGVRTTDSDLQADLVIDATGRRSPIDRWLKNIGAQPGVSSWAECGVAYFSRHYRLRDGASPPGAATTRRVEAFDEFTAGIWGADNGTMQLVVAPLAMDHRFKTLRYPEVFTAVLRTVPTFARWLDALEPITDVFPMGGVHNTLRRLVVDGAPVATGLAAIGDSVCTTNPTLGRGLALALAGAVDLLAIVHDHGEDWTAQALAADACVAEHVLPFYDDQAVIDAARLAVLRHHIFDTPPPPNTSPSSERVTFAQLRAAAEFDPTAFRALWRLMGMLSPPDRIYSDPQVVARTSETLRAHGSGPTMIQPSQDELRAALTPDPTPTSRP